MLNEPITRWMIAGSFAGGRLVSFRGGRPCSWRTATLVFGAATVAGLMVGLGPQLQTIAPSGWAVSFLYLTLGLACIWPLALAVLGHRGDLLAPRYVFGAMYSLYFVLWPIWVAAAGYSEIYGVGLQWAFASEADQSRTLLFALLAIAALDVGYFGVGGAMTAVTSRSGASAPSPCDTLSILPATAQLPIVTVSGLLLAGSASYYLLANKAGGVIYLLGHIDEWRAVSAGSAPLMWGISLMVHASTLMLLYWGATRKHALATLCLVVSSTGVTLLSGSRMDAVTAVLAAAVVWHYTIRSFSVTWKTLLFLVAFVFGNGIYVFHRMSSAESSALWDTGSLAKLFFDSVIGRFAGTEALYRIIQRTDHVGPDGPKYFVADMMFSWVPRVLMPDKPLTSGYMFNIEFFPDVFSSSNALSGAAVPTLAGESYWMAGLAGMLVVMLVVGFSMRAAYEWMRTHRSPTALLCYSSVFVFAAFCNETLSLHAFRLVLRCLIWLAVLAAVSLEARLWGRNVQGAPHLDHVERSSRSEANLASVAGGSLHP